MGSIEKIKILDEFEQLDFLSDIQFENIKKYFSDDDSFVRSRCAALLCNFSFDQEAKNLLIQLAQDSDPLVRVEAFDSLSYFFFEDVGFFLKSSITKEKTV